jgi:hypothetical protein
LFNLSGIEVDPIIHELEPGGARLVCAKHYDLFHVGQMIGPAALSLDDEGMHVVYPIVKFRKWPVIGVEFMEISDKHREVIMRFLSTVEHRRLQQM